MKKLQYTVSGDYVSVISLKRRESECPHALSYFIKSGDFPGAASKTPFVVLSGVRTPVRRNFPYSQDPSCGLPRFLYNVYRVSFPGIK